MANLEQRVNGNKGSLGPRLFAFGACTFAGGIFLESALNFYLNSKPGESWHDYYFPVLLSTAIGTGLLCYGVTRARRILNDYK